MELDYVNPVRHHSPSPQPRKHGRGRIRDSSWDKKWSEQVQHNSRYVGGNDGTGIIRRTTSNKSSSSHRLTELRVCTHQSSLSPPPPPPISDYEGEVEISLPKLPTSLTGTDLHKAQIALVRPIDEQSQESQSHLGVYENFNVRARKKSLSESAFDVLSKEEFPPRPPLPSQDSEELKGKQKLDASSSLSIERLNQDSKQLLHMEGTEDAELKQMIPQSSSGDIDKIELRKRKSPKHFNFGSKGSSKYSMTATKREKEQKIICDQDKSFKGGKNYLNSKEESLSENKFRKFCEKSEVDNSTSGFGRNLESPKERKFDEKNSTGPLPPMREDSFGRMQRLSSGKKLHMDTKNKDFIKINKPAFDQTSCNPSSNIRVPTETCHQMATSLQEASSLLGVSLDTAEMNSDVYNQVYESSVKCHEKTFNSSKDIVADKVVQYPIEKEAKYNTIKPVKDIDENTEKFSNYFTQQETKTVSLSKNSTQISVSDRSSNGLYGDETTDMSKTFKKNASNAVSKENHDRSTQEGQHIDARVNRKNEIDSKVKLIPLTSGRSSVSGIWKDVSTGQVQSRKYLWNCQTENTSFKRCVSASDIGRHTQSRSRYFSGSEEGSRKWTATPTHIIRDVMSDNQVNKTTKIKNAKISTQRFDSNSIMKNTKLDDQSFSHRQNINKNNIPSILETTKDVTQALDIKNEEKVQSSFVPIKNAFSSENNELSDSIQFESDEKKMSPSSGPAVKPTYINDVTTTKEVCVIRNANQESPFGPHSSVGTNTNTSYKRSNKEEVKDSNVELPSAKVIEEQILAVEKRLNYLRVLEREQVHKLDILKASLVRRNELNIMSRQDTTFGEKDNMKNGTTHSKSIIQTQDTKETTNKTFIRTNKQIEVDESQHMITEEDDALLSFEKLASTFDASQVDLDVSELSYNEDGGEVSVAIELSTFDQTSGNVTPIPSKNELFQQSTCLSDSLTETTKQDEAPTSSSILTLTNESDKATVNVRKNISGYNFSHQQKGIYISNSDAVCHSGGGGGGGGSTWM